MSISSTVCVRTIIMSMGDTPEAWTSVPQQNSYGYWSFRNAKKKRKKGETYRHSYEAMKLVMKLLFISDTYSSRMATYSSSGLKIQMEGRLRTLFKGRRG
jgi:hypothetical protein